MKKEAYKTAYLMACGSLQDFLTLTQPYEILQLTFKLTPSAKDLLEAQGIPHTAIFRLFINGRSGALNRPVKDGDTLVAYSMESLSAAELPPVIIRPSSFLVDSHLGKLAKALRLMGLDAATFSGPEYHSVTVRSNQYKRMVLTRNLQLLEHGELRYGYWVRSSNPEEQLREVFSRFDLSAFIQPFSRCMECNGQLQKTSLAKVKNKVPPKVRERHEMFYQCNQCGHIYWQGSHYQRLQQKVTQLMQLTER